MKYSDKKSDLLYGYIAPVSITLFLALFAILAFFSIWHQRKIVSTDVLVSDINRLEQIFDKINNTAGIISFDYQKNWINFLTIKKEGFVGSEVGSMNLIHPGKWEGPYLDDNLVYQGIEYQVVRTKDGYFIVPGERTTLPNGKQIGKDIILNEEANIPLLIKEKNLKKGGKPFAVKIKIGGSASY